ncbi:TIGR02234 family membrane protein [Streptomyces triticagri]|uniref:TIGR02234 family membrane protein n=1 Tax=Streptomyces triticagri TaxID=2293568 RepID=A0A372M4Z4_9ACTN|nr:TIGR02234 family membrane protein [Streptomyces triticagri]RFU85879.1 TIGR02234 family membrane protein [Streptomyces triticagri]
MEGVTAVPNPRTTATAVDPDAPSAADDAAAPTSSGRRSLAVALFSGALGAAVVLLASRQTWSEGEAATAGGALHQIVKGSDVTGAPAALAVVGLAALVAVFAVRRTGRILVSALLALSGLGTVAAALAGAGDDAALDEKAATATGDAAAGIASVTHTAWPYAAVAGGALLLLAGLLALRFGGRWPAMSGRYERDGSPRPRMAPARVDPDRPEDLWKALDRGEDPTG